MKYLIQIFFLASVLYSQDTVVFQENYNYNVHDGIIKKNVPNSVAGRTSWGWFQVCKS